MAASAWAHPDTHPETPQTPGGLPVANTPNKGPLVAAGSFGHTSPHWPPQQTPHQLKPSRFTSERFTTEDRLHTRRRFTQAQAHSQPCSSTRHAARPAIPMCYQDCVTVVRSASFTPLLSTQHGRHEQVPKNMVARSPQQGKHEPKSGSKVALAGRIVAWHWLHSYVKGGTRLRPICRLVCCRFRVLTGRLIHTGHIEEQL